MLNNILYFFIFLISCNLKEVRVAILFMWLWLRYSP